MVISKGSTTGDYTQRTMQGDSGSVLYYNLYKNAAWSDVWGDTVGTDDLSGTTVIGNLIIEVFGRIAGNQSGLTAPGVHTDSPLKVTVSY